MPEKVLLSGDDDQQLMTQATWPESDDYEIVSKVHKWWRHSDQKCATNIQDERNDHAFAAGHQWDESELEILKPTGRVPIVINKTLPTLMVVSGQERGNRMRVRYMPVESQDTLKAEIWTEVARVVQEQSGLDFNRSDSFMDMLKGGRGFTALYLDYGSNPAGDIQSARVMPWEVRIDPTSRDEDLLDSRYFLWSRQVTMEQLLSLWPEKADDLAQASLVANSMKGATETDHVRESDYDTLASGAKDQASGLWTLTEAWYWQVEMTGEYLGRNNATGEWEPIKDKQALLALLMIDPGMEYRREPRHEKKFYQAFVCGPVLLQHNPSPYEYQGFPFVPVYGLYDDEDGRFFGMVRGMKDPQRETNKRRTQVLHIINRAAKSGWYGPKGSYVDKDMWEEESSRPGVILEYDVEPPQQPPQPLQPPPVPMAFIQLEQMAAVDLRDVSGVNIELMGLSQKDTPGIVTNQRQRQALTILQNYFDNLKKSSKVLGKMLMSLMQQFYTDGRQYQINGIPEVEVAALTPQMKMGRYDLVVEEAPYSPNQKMETAIKMQAIVEMALKARIPIPPKVLEYLDLPQALLKEWQDLLTRAMQPPMQPPGGMPGAPGLPHGGPSMPPGVPGPPLQ